MTTKKQPKKAKSKQNPRPKSTTPRKAFVKNADIYAELLKWRDSHKDPAKRVMSDQLGEYIYKIASRLTGHAKFRGYSDDVKADLVSTACYKVVSGIKNYKFEYTNAFAYITQICWNAFVAVLSKYYKHQNGMRRFYIESIAEVTSHPLSAGNRKYLNKIKSDIKKLLDDVEKTVQQNRKNQEDIELEKEEDEAEEIDQEQYI